MPDIITTTGFVPISSVGDPGASKVVGSVGGVATGVFPPGYRIATATYSAGAISVNVVEASAVSIISLGAITFDGTPCYFEFFCPTVITAAVLAAQCNFNLWGDGVDLGRVYRSQTTAAAAMQVNAFFRFPYQPSAASHTYEIRGWSAGGAASVTNGVGGAATPLPISFAAIKA